MTTPDIEAADGSTYTSSAMAELAAQLEEVRTRRGELTPQAVLDVARDRKHPLHDRFEWDNKIAGERHRLDQAHRLIRSVRIVWTTDTEEKRVRKFVAIPRTTSYQPDYEPVEAVVLDPLKRKIMLRDAERQWKALRRRFADLEGFAEMVLQSLHDEAS